jgi:hypothetical protein
VNDRRTKVLALVTAVAAVAFVADRAFTYLWWEPWTKVSQEIQKTDLEISKANTTLSREAIVRKDWTRVKTRLDEPRVPDIHTSFLSHLGEIFEKTGVAFDVSENPQPAQQGDFKEYLFDTKFKLTWPQFINLLVELHNSKEFLKPVRMNIGSQYEKEDSLDLELRVSTIEYSPGTAKPGAPK